MQNPLAVGQCTGIEVTVADDRGFPPLRPDKKQASGWDFDLEFTAASPDAFAWRDERHRLLCAKAPTAPFAVVVARYPGQQLKSTERVPGLVLERAIQVMIQGGTQAYSASPLSQPAGVGSAADPTTGYPTGSAPGITPTNGYPAPVAPPGAFPAPQAAPSGYPAPGFPNAGGAPAYGGAPTADPTQAYSGAGAPAYPSGNPAPTYSTGAAAAGYPPQPTAGYNPASVATAAPGQASSGVPMPQPVAQAQPVAPAQPDAAPPRNLKQLFQKITGNAKQSVRDVAGQTVNYTAETATAAIDNKLFSGNASGGDPKDITAALASGRIVLKQLRFQEHTSNLDSSNGPLLAQLAQALVATPAQYLIEGHVDQTEGNQAQALSEQRAAAVKHALVSSGVSPMQLVAAGYGATRPLSSGSSARIEIARTQ
jgi:outer membrane protein OmpA-like peptidoglycan-associated protein